MQRGMKSWKGAWGITRRDGTVILLSSVNSVYLAGQGYILDF